VKTARGAESLVESPSTDVRGEGLRVSLFSDAIPRRNGVGTYYDDLVHQLRDRGVGAALHAPPAQDEAGVGWQLPLPGDPTQALHLPAVLDIWRRVGSSRPHVMVAATPGFFGMLGVAAAVRYRTPLCVAHHTEFSKLAGAYWSRVLGALVRPALGWWDRFVMRRGDVVLVHNTELVHEVERSVGRDVRLVGTPAPPAFLDTPPPPPPDAVHDILFVGRLAAEKRIDAIVRAAEELPELSFRIVGDGPLRGEVEAAADRLPNLSQRGWVGRDDVLREVDACDALVLPSRHETFGSVALEAMLRGRCVLVSPRCGIARWPALSEGLFVMGEEESLTTAVRRVRGLAADRRERVVRTGLVAARRLCDRTIDHWIQLLSEVAGRDEGEAQSRGDGARR